MSGRADCDMMIDILLVNITANLLMEVEMPLACLHKVHEPDLVLEEMGSFVVKWAHSALPYFVKLRKEFEQAISFSNHCPKSLTKKSKTRTALCLSTVTEVLFHLFLYFMLIWLLIT